ncbi:MAG: shikimate kinase [Spirulina sp. SIO3F2]|nr:shikimate kinase [Spirulina sp. SIO3F2]
MTVAQRLQTVNDDHPTLPNLSLFLIGMMGSGKTTVGKALARQLTYRFFDADVLVERVAGQSVPEIFAQQGEAAFRQLESQILSELSSYTQSVIATGGGAAAEPHNWRYLRQGIVIWLDAPITLLCQRLQGNKNRPLLQDVDLPTKLQTLMGERRDRYVQADLCITVDAQDTPEAIATRIITQIPSILKDPLRPIIPDTLDAN